MIETYVPFNTISTKSKTPKHIRKLLLKKKKLYIDRQSSPFHKAAYKKCSKDYDMAVASWCDKIERSICSSHNPSSFYGYAKRKLKARPGIPLLRCDDLVLAESDLAKANLFNETFHNIFQADNGHHLQLACIVPPHQSLCDIDISTDDVSRAIHRVPDKVSRTPDGIPAYFLKRVSGPLLDVICFLFKLSLSKGVIPLQWKSAIITPVFKKGSRDLPSNYCPVSLTCVLCRVFEHIVADHLLYHLSFHNLISANQFGFLPGRSSCSQLLSVFNCWSHMLDTHETFDVIYTDIAKAFDSVTHSLMVLTIKFLTGLIVFCTTAFNLYVSITAILIVYLSIVEFLKAVSWGPFFLLFLLMMLSKLPLYLVLFVARFCMLMTLSFLVIALPSCSML